MISETESTGQEVAERHTLDEEMRVRMHRLHEAHNRRLGGFLGRDLSLWNSGVQGRSR